MVGGYRGLLGVGFGLLGESFYVLYYGVLKFVLSWVVRLEIMISINGLWYFLRDKVDVYMFLMVVMVVLMLLWCSKLGMYYEVKWIDYWLLFWY